MPSFLEYFVVFSSMSSFQEQMSVEHADVHQSLTQTQENWWVCAMHFMYTDERLDFLQPQT